jgi:hypothetical protein
MGSIVTSMAQWHSCTEDLGGKKKKKLKLELLASDETELWPLPPNWTRSLFCFCITILRPSVLPENRAAPSANE